MPDTQSVYGILVIHDDHGQPSERLEHFLQLLRTSHIARRAVLEVWTRGRQPAEDSSKARFGIEIRLVGEPSDEILGVYEVENPLDPLPLGIAARLALDEPPSGDRFSPDLRRLGYPPQPRGEVVAGSLVVIAGFVCFAGLFQSAQEAWGGDAFILSLAGVLTVMIAYAANRFRSRGKGKLSAAMLCFLSSFLFLFLPWFASPGRIVARNERKLDKLDFAIRMDIEKQIEARRLELQSARLDQEVNRKARPRNRIWAHVMTTRFAGEIAAVASIWVGFLKVQLHRRRFERRVGARCT